MQAVDVTFVSILCLLRLVCWPSIMRLLLLDLLKLIDVCSICVVWLITHWYTNSPHKIDSLTDIKDGI